jgi:histidyl-tRNA synthetase
MRVLDSKDEGDREATADAPVILDYLSAECQEHFEAVTGLLTKLGIAYTIDPRLVRGLDYYTRTAFEFVSSDLGSQDALGGGGRYDALVEQLGGKPTPSVGFASGIERLLMVMEKMAFPFPTSQPDVYIVALDDESRSWAFETAVTLRSLNLAVDLDYAARSMKAQMREANRCGAQSVLIVGEAELARKTAVLKNMADGTQTDLPFEKITIHFTGSSH